MAEPLAPVVLIDRDELEALRLEADRYRWLRNHSVRIQGSVLWYSEAALDDMTVSESGIPPTPLPLAVQLDRSSGHHWA